MFLIWPTSSSVILTWLLLQALYKLYLQQTVSIPAFVLSFILSKALLLGAVTSEERDKTMDHHSSINEDSHFDNWDCNMWQTKQRRPLNNKEIVTYSATCLMAVVYEHRACVWIGGWGSFSDPEARFWYSAALSALCVYPHSVAVCSLAMFSISGCPRYL